jgi:concanavalin A-like lectin/glucanase superfamily protein
MVNFTDLKYYDSTSSLGGAINTSDPIQTATSNNLFTGFSRSELIAGTTKYKCFYLKNESAEDMDNFKIWISKGTPLDYTSIHFGFDNVASPFDGAIGFDGTNDYIDCTDDATLWSKSLTKFSFAVWIYPTAGWDGNSRVIVSHGGTSAQSFRCYVSPSTTGRVIFEIRDSVPTTFTASSDSLVLNQWNHVICSYDNSLGTQNLRVYVAGVLGGTTANVTAAINISSTLTIADSTTDFKGYIKDFKFWDTNSIDSTEAVELYDDNELAATPPSYHLQFGERTGSTTKDNVTKTKVATLTNGAFWALSAIAIANETTAPDVYNNKWYQAQEIPKTFKLKSGLYTPIWVQVQADDNDANDVLDDSGIFTINFDITATGTGSGGTPGTGGGTGGNPGGSGTTDYKIAFAGDWGNTGYTTDVIDMMKSQNYDLIIGIGDNAYDDSSATTWCNKFAMFKDKMESAFGNHEYEESGGISPYKSFFGYSKTYNSFRFQNCLILIIDSNDDISEAPSLDTQRVWVKEELDKYVSDTNVVWRIIVMHHPWFGTGAKHDENEFDQVQKFHKLFTDYDVNFVYTGHNHHWMRSHQVSYNSADPVNPNVVDSSTPYSRVDTGLMEIRSGTGGHDGPSGMYSLSADAAFWAYRNKSNNGVHELVASDTGKTLTGRFRNVDNETSDTFTITA